MGLIILYPFLINNCKITGLDMAAKKGATAGTPFRVKVKKVGKAKKSFGPKEQKPKKYVGQGR